MIRAEALFRRFQRTVETIDKKHNFPTPSVRQRRPAEQEANPPTPASSSSGTDARRPRQGTGDAVAKGIGAEKKEEGQKEKVISPELRGLLSRKVEKLDKTQVVEHGGGVGNPA